MRLAVLVAILGLLALYGPAYSQSGVPASGAPSPQGVADFVLYPWVTVLLLFVGMMLLISQLMSIGGWGVTGTAGVFCLGVVLASHALAGAAAWFGVVLILAGIGLLLVESRVLPGYGVSGAAGLACLFVGCYLMLGGAAAGVLFAILASALVTVLSAIAFLVHLPQNSAWQAVGRKLEMRVGRPYSTAVEGRVEIAGADSLAAETQEISEKESAGTSETDEAKKEKLAGTDTESDEEQQILGRDE